jgi:hypothetical protein
MIETLVGGTVPVPLLFAGRGRKVEVLWAEKNVKKWGGGGEGPISMHVSP